LGALVSAMVATTAGLASAAPSVCYTIQHGDTAALISWRMTGSVDQTYEPWFQIVDGYSRVVPKSQYLTLRAGWRACVPSSRLAVTQHRPQDRPGTGSGGILQTVAASIAAGAWLGVAVLVVMLVAHAGWEHARRRRAIVSILQRFGERFVEEFERPLRMRGSNEPAVESRLCVIARRQRLEILLAPAGRRRYPNLTDHRRNVAYDADRIVRLLKDQRVVDGQLTSRGKWVVIACRFEICPEERGRK